MPSTDKTTLCSVCNSRYGKPIHTSTATVLSDWLLDCLGKNNYNDAKCQSAVKALYECCEAFYDRQGDDARTASCPLPDTLRLKLQQQKEGK